jgi:eukaryotic-like serine/threonine-protein kinase
MGATLLIYRNDGGNVRSVAWSPDSKLIASADDEKVQVWDANSGIIVLSYCDHTDKIKGLAWSSDGTRIASASNDGMVKIWLVDTGETLITYTGHSVWRNQADNLVAWSPDGTYIASVGINKLVHIWAAATGEKVFTYRGHSL